MFSCPVSKMIVSYVLLTSFNCLPFPLFNLGWWHKPKLHLENRNRKSSLKFLPPSLPTRCIYFKISASPLFATKHLALTKIHGPLYLHLYIFYLSSLLFSSLPPLLFLLFTSSLLHLSLPLVHLHTFSPLKYLSNTSFFLVFHIITFTLYWNIPIRVFIHCSTSYIFSVKSLWPT